MQTIWAWSTNRPRQESQDKSGFNARTLEHAVHGLDDRRLCGDRPKVVVENLRGGGHVWFYVVFVRMRPFGQRPGRRARAWPCTRRRRKQRASTACATIRGPPRRRTPSPMMSSPRLRNSVSMLTLAGLRGGGHAVRGSPGSLGADQAVRKAWTDRRRRPAHSSSQASMPRKQQSALNASPRACRHPPR